MLIRFDTEISINNEACKSAAEYLQNRISRILDYHLPIISEGVCGICLTLDSRAFRYENVADNIRSQGYEIIADRNGVEVLAASKAGLLHGCAELVAAIGRNGAFFEDGFHIISFPKLAVRGFYHDATRGRVQKICNYKQMVDRMVDLKLNQLQLYVEHSFKFSFLPEIWKDNTPLTPEDIKELDAYCRERGIDLVPSISTFGHMYTILRTKEYAGLCELTDPEKAPFSFVDRMQHHTLDTTNPGSIELVKRILSEYMPLFSSRYVNICADETFDLGKGRSGAYVEKVGEARAYVDFLKQIMQIVLDAGKIPMFWGDILAQFPEYAKELPSGVICLNWGYSTNEEESRAADFEAQGLRQYLCPGVQGWNHLINRLDWACQNISLMTGYAVKHHAEGLLNTDWGDFGHINDPAFSVPGMAYGAYMSWEGEIAEDAADARISRVIYGDASETLIPLMKQLSACETVNWWSYVTYKESVQKGESAEEVIKRFGFNRPENYLETIQKMMRLTEKLAALMPSVNSDGKELIRRLLLHAEGQMLVDESFFTVISGKYFHFLRLPERMDKFIAAYDESWRESSRESELGRVDDVLRWYQDEVKALM